MQLLSQFLSWKKSIASLKIIIMKTTFAHLALLVGSSYQENLRGTLLQHRSLPAKTTETIENVISLISYHGLRKLSSSSDDESSASESSASGDSDSTSLSDDRKLSSSSDDESSASGDSDSTSLSDDRKLSSSSVDESSASGDSDSASSL